MITIHIIGPTQRLYAKACINDAPDGYTVTIAPPKRSLDANARLWAMLADVARAMPEGRMHTPEVWNAFSCKPVAMPCGLSWGWITGHFR